ncbi:MAG: hypothetical protein GY792_23155 [Gammaproteobacteria bacterium]|nr:hypothetical protein [Gammaproteobacteria bacterium]
MSGRLLEDVGECLCLLSLLLAPPGEALLRLLRSDPGLSDGSEWPNFYLDDDKLLERLQEEHTRLFVSGFPHLDAPPFAAEYLDEEPGQLLVSLQERLTASGMRVSRSEAGRPDHLRVLLEAAGHLADAGERHRFLERYLVPWFPVYRNRLESAARLPLYPALIEAVESLVLSETSENSHERTAVTT